MEVLTKQNSVILRKFFSGSLMKQIWKLGFVIVTTGLILLLTQQFETICMNSIYYVRLIAAFHSFSRFSLDMSTAMEILQNVVNNMVQEFLQPDVNNLTPKQDWRVCPSFSVLVSVVRSKMFFVDTFLWNFWVRRSDRSKLPQVGVW